MLVTLDSQRVSKRSWLGFVVSCEEVEKERLKIVSIKKKQWVILLKNFLELDLKRRHAIVVVERTFL